MAGLGDLSPMLNMMRQRKQDRANNEYRDSVLAQRDAELAYQKTQDVQNNEARNRQLLATEESVRNQTAQQANQDRAADALNIAYENKIIASSIIPIIGPGLTIDEYGGFNVSDDVFEKLWATDKESVVNVLKQSPQFTAVRSPSGGEYETVKIEELGDDRYAVIVGNAETEGPLTEGGTTDDADPVIEFDGATLRRIFANGLGGMMSNGGWESPQAQIYGTMMNDAVLRADMVKLAAQGLGDQTSQLGQAGDTGGVIAGRRALLDVNNASYDELAQMIIDVHGMSAEDVAAQFPRPTQQSPTSQSSGNPRLPSAAESGEEAIASLEAMGLSFERSEDGAFGAMNIPENASPKLKSLLKGFEQRRSPSAVDVNDPDSMTDEADQYRSRMAMSSAKKSTRLRERLRNSDRET